MSLFTGIDGTKHEVTSLYTGIDGTRMSIDHIPVGIDGTMYQIKLGNMCTVTFYYSVSGLASDFDLTQNISVFSRVILDGKTYAVYNVLTTNGEATEIAETGIGTLLQIDVRTQVDASTAVILNGETVFTGGLKTEPTESSPAQICIFRVDGDIEISLVGAGFGDSTMVHNTSPVTITGAATLISVPGTE